MTLRVKGGFFRIMMRKNPPAMRRVFSIWLSQIEDDEAAAARIFHKKMNQSRGGEEEFFAPFFPNS